MQCGLKWFFTLKWKARFQSFLCQKVYSMKLKVVLRFFNALRNVCLIVETCCFRSLKNFDFLPEIFCLNSGEKLYKEWQTFLFLITFISSTLLNFIFFWIILQTKKFLYFMSKYFYTQLLNFSVVFRIFLCQIGFCW